MTGEAHTVAQVAGWLVSQHPGGVRDFYSVSSPDQIQTEKVRRVVKLAKAITDCARVMCDGEEGQ